MNVNYKQRYKLNPGHFLVCKSPLSILSMEDLVLIDEINMYSRYPWYPWGFSWG